jgi:hypothetical protein
MSMNSATWRVNRRVQKIRELFTKSRELFVNSIERTELDYRPDAIRGFEDEHPLRRTA